MLHSHFDLAEDEMMMETTDLDNREHLVRQVRRWWVEAEDCHSSNDRHLFEENGYNQNCGLSSAGEWSSPFVSTRLRLR